MDANFIINFMIIHILYYPMFCLYWSLILKIFNIHSYKNMLLLGLITFASTTYVEATIHSFLWVNILNVASFIIPALLIGKLNDKTKNNKINYTNYILVSFCVYIFYFLVTSFISHLILVYYLENILKQNLFFEMLTYKDITLLAKSTVFLFYPISIVLYVVALKIIKLINKLIAHYKI